MTAYKEYLKKEIKEAWDTFSRCQALYGNDFPMTIKFRTKWADLVTIYSNLYGDEYQKKGNIITEKKFVLALKKELKSCIKGEIYVHITNGNMIVDVIGFGSLCYRYVLLNLSLELSANLLVEDVINEIVVQYKKKVLDTYFY
jgi:hypothetical protein